jgi:hypothetical protein
MVKKYKLKKDLPNFFKEGVALENINWYKSGDIIIFNPWVMKYGKQNDTYQYRMIKQEYIESNPEFFEAVIE